MTITSKKKLASPYSQTAENPLMDEASIRIKNKAKIIEPRRLLSKSRVVTISLFVRRASFGIEITSTWKKRWFVLTGNKGAWGSS